MKISYYYPSQIIVKKDLLFCKHTGYDFLHHKCDSTVDMIYAGSISVLSEAMKAKVRFNKPLICWVWDIPYNWKEWEMSEEGIRVNASRDVVNKSRVELLKKCDLIIAGSKWTQKVLKEQYGISSEQIYFYIDMNSIDLVGSQRKEKKIVQISRYFYNKKFEHTIMASKDLTNYKAVFIGANLNSTYGKWLKEYSNKYNRNVVFNEILSRRDIITNIKKSVVLVSPSVFEGWGMTPAEALYCRVPVLLSDLDVFKEQYGNSVLYHKKNDINDMKEKLELLIADKDLQKKIVKECQPIIAEFTVEKFVQRWKKIVK